MSHHYNIFFATFSLASEYALSGVVSTLFFSLLLCLIPMTNQQKGSNSHYLRRPQIGPHQAWAHICLGPIANWTGPESTCIDLGGQQLGLTVDQT